VLQALRRSHRCRNWALAGSRRCRLHGGLATGARTPEGKQRQADGRRQWRENLRADGRKPGPAKGTGGRPRGSHNPSERHWRATAYDSTKPSTGAELWRNGGEWPVSRPRVGKAGDGCEF
jgi:hypothetical protein